MKRYQVIRTGLSPYQSQDFLAQEEALVSHFPTLTYRSLKDFKADQDSILITNTHTRLRSLPAKLLEISKLIIHPNSGYDHFEADYDFLKNTPLVVGHIIRAQAVAEYSLGALFEGLLELPQHLTWHETRTWKRSLLKGTNVWVFGHGHIGKIIADTLVTLGMIVTIVDPYKPGCLKHWNQGSLKKARVIISAMGLNQITKHIFSADFFSNLSDEVLFINGARGSLVDEISLKSYLKSNPKSFAFLDVFENEPFGNEWFGFPQVWKTSHIAGVEKDLDQKILDFERMVLTDYLTVPHAGFLKKYEQELLQNKWIKGVLV